MRSRRHRQKQGRFLIDGLREINRAVEGKIEFVETFVCKSKCPASLHEALHATLERLDSGWIEVSEPVFEKLAFGARAEGIVAVAVTPQKRLGEIVLPPCPLIAVIEGIEKPGNVGAVLRSADGAGLDAVILADGRTDLYNPNAIRASLGTIFTLPVCEATSEQTLAWLRAQGLTIHAARVDGAAPYTEADFRRPAALVLGSEALGLSDAWRGDDVFPVRLPMHGAADSLNISASAAVLFYEARRQRDHSKNHSRA